MDLRTELLIHYKDELGLITVDRDPGIESTKDGMMHTGLAICYMNNLGLLCYTKDFYWIEGVVNSLQVEKGLYASYPAYWLKPICPDDNGHDDTNGVIAASMILGNNFEREVLDYGKKNLFIYNNSNPGKFFTSFNPWKWEWWALRLRFLHLVLWYFNVNNKLRYLSLLLLIKLYFSTILATKPTYFALLNFMIVDSMSRDSNVWKKFKKWFIEKSMLASSTLEYFKSKEHPLYLMALEIERRNKDVK